jgi:hypothetical protein
VTRATIPRVRWDHNGTNCTIIERQPLADNGRHGRTRFAIGCKNAQQAYRVALSARQNIGETTVNIEPKSLNMLGYDAGHH